MIMQCEIGSVDLFGAEKGWSAQHASQLSASLPTEDRISGWNL